MAGTASSGGRNKKSIQQHRLQRTYRKSRHATAADPKAPEGVPVPPKALSGDALAEWHRMIARMQACQTLALVDDAVLYQYVQLFAETEALVTEQSKMRALIERLDGEIAELEQPGRGAAMTQLIKLKQVESRFPSQIRQSRMALRQYPDRIRHDAIGQNPRENVRRRTNG